MDVKFVIWSYVLCCLANIVKSFHSNSMNRFRPMGQMKQPPPGVFHVGPLPQHRQNQGRVHVFTNPPIPTTHAPPLTTTPVPVPIATTTPIPTTTKPYDWGMYFATTYPSTKKGMCPNFDAVHANCYGRCHRDDDCFYERKCCRDGYGFGCCIDPVQPGMFDNFFGGGPTTNGFFWKKK